jgi:uncharacterized protein YjiS (DUF1127 family)
MNTQTQLTDGTSDFIMRCTQSLMDGWAALRQTLREQHQRTLDRIELGRLDDHALRDLGICRSEFESINAESRIDAELTRRRVALPWRD